MTTKTLPAGPQGSWIMGSLREFQRDALGFLTASREQYGDVVPFRLGGVRAVAFNHPDQIEQILVHRHKQFIKSDYLRRGKVLLGEGLLTSEGQFWLRQRRLAQPAFHRDRILGYGTEMARLTAQMLDSWRDGEVRDIHDDMIHLTMRIITRTMFGADLGDEEGDVGQSIEVAIREWNEMAFRPPFTDTWPLPGNRRLKAAVERLDLLVYRLIRERRQSGADPGDLLSMLLSARDEDGSAMSDKQLRDEVLTLFGAGHETTANSLTWTWHLLGQHPAVRQRLEAELGALLAGRLPTVADLPQLRYTTQVITESMRLYPPAWAISRDSVERVEIGGYPLTAGTLVITAPWVVHRDPRWFPEPEAFRPERWDGELEKRLPTYAYFPFGGGPRVCIGRQFAQMEAVLILAAVAQRYRMCPVEGHPVVPETTVTLRPRHGLQMRLSRI